MGIRSQVGRDTQLMALTWPRSGRALDLFAPPQAPYGALLMRNAPLALGQSLLNEALRAVPGSLLYWRLYRLRSDQSASRYVDRFDHRPTMQIAARGCFADYWQSPRPVRWVQRQLRRLHSGGLTPEFRVITAPEHMSTAIDEHASLEAHGWKGRTRSAIIGSTPAGKFYRQLLDLYSRRGCGFVFQLYLSGRLVASQLAIRGGDHLALLKTTFDERFRQYGPGRLLDYMMLRHLFDTSPGLIIDFCNVAGGDDLRWATHASQLHTGYVYRNYALRLLAGIARCLPGRSGG